MSRDRQPEQITLVSNALPVVHGGGERYQVRLGVHGFYVVDTDMHTEDGKSIAVISSVLTQKFRARERCDRLNSEEARS